MYIDTHSHIYFPQFDDDRDLVLARMRESGVVTIAVGTSLATSKQAIEIAQAHPDVVVGATIGIHPNDTEETFDAETFAELITEQVVGVGECGLDYYRQDDTNETEKARQKANFEAQIVFAAAHDLPLMLHVRPSKGSDDAHLDALEILRASSAKLQRSRGTAHFFTGSIEMAREYWMMGFCTSFPGVITFAKETEEVVREAPAHLMLAETDAPYAAPKPYRGARNEPVYVIEVVKKIAELRGEPIEAVSWQLVENSKRMFGV